MLLGQNPLWPCWPSRPAHVVSAPPLVLMLPELVMPLDRIAAQPRCTMLVPVPARLCAVSPLATLRTSLHHLDDS
jgi:hypothetical protein